MWEGNFSKKSVVEGQESFDFKEEKAGEFFKGGKRQFSQKNRTLHICSMINN